MSYTKLFQSIITSTIWSEDDQTRIVWVTLLALADKDGEIAATVPGLARLAGVSVEAADAALAKFMSPDPYSRTPDDEGRRIEEIDGGWALLNHAKYRLMGSKEESKSKNAERQKRHRERQKRNATVTPRNATVTHERDIAEAEAEAEDSKNVILSDSAPVASDDVGFLEELWEMSPRPARPRTSKRQVADEWRRIKAADKPNRAIALRAYAAWVNSPEWTRDGGQYVPGLHLWIKRRQWDNVPEAPKPNRSNLPQG